MPYVQGVRDCQRHGLSAHGWYGVSGGLARRRHDPQGKNLMARRPVKKKVRKPRSPGDYEAELVRLCKGNQREAERLITEELERSPSMSRQGAALALVTRIRHARAPVSRPL